MKNIIYFTQGPVATTVELNEILTIQQEIAQSHQLRVFNENESPAFGAGNAPADYANGTVPADYKHLPKFTGLGGGGLVMQNFLLELQTITLPAVINDTNNEFKFLFTSLGIASGYMAGMRIASNAQISIATSSDATNLVITVSEESVPGFVMLGLDKSGENSYVLPIQFVK